MTDDARTRYTCSACECEFYGDPSETLCGNCAESLMPLRTTDDWPGFPFWERIRFT